MRRERAPAAARRGVRAATAAPSLTREILAPPPFSLRQLQYAIAVSEALSFRRAAERCCVSQPSLSTQLKELERVLGVRLFERDRRRVLITPAGRTVLAAARRALTEASDLFTSARVSGRSLEGPLRLGVIPTIAPYLLPTLAPALRVAYPRLIPIWTEEKTDHLVQQLASGELEAALVAREAELGDAVCVNVAIDPFLLAAAPGHPLAERFGDAALEELSGAAVLLLDDGHCFRSQALRHCSRARARELGYRATSLGTLAQMVAGGEGVTLLPKLAVPTEATRAGLKVRAFAAPVPHRTIALMWRKGSPMTPVLTRLAHAIRAAYPKNPH